MANSDYYVWCNAVSDERLHNIQRERLEGVQARWSARPATCTTGVAYWATDQGNWNTSGSGGQGELFKRTDRSNTWDALVYAVYLSASTGRRRRIREAAASNEYKAYCFAMMP